MKNYLRLIIVIALVAGIAVLAKNKLAWAGGTANSANQADLAFARGFVWNDVDRDGVQDVRERGLRGVTVDLYDSAKKLVNTAVTDENGRFQFDDLLPGDYYIDLVPPTGYIVSPKDQAGDEALDSDADITTGETILTTLVAGENTLMWDAGLYNPSLLLGSPGPGTVRPPPADITACNDGTHSVGGVSTLNVSSLRQGYCLAAFLRNNAFAIGRIPDGAGQVLAHITFLRVFYQNRFIYELPEADGAVEICYAVPPSTQAKIYFYNFYGPQFGQRAGQPSWEPLETTVSNGIACAPAKKSGAYALIGK